MPTYADFGGRVISTIAGWFVVTADRNPGRTCAVLELLQTDTFGIIWPNSFARYLAHVRNNDPGEASIDVPSYLRVYTCIHYGVQRGKEEKNRSGSLGETSRDLFPQRTSCQGEAPFGGAAYPHGKHSALCR